MTCQHNVPPAVDAGFTSIMVNKREGRYAWCLCVERFRGQLSSISDKTVRCGGHKNLNELYVALRRPPKLLPVRDLLDGLHRRHQICVPARRVSGGACRCPRWIEGDAKRRGGCHREEREQGGHTERAPEKQRRGQNLEQPGRGCCACKKLQSINVVQ